MRNPITAAVVAVGLCLFVLSVAIAQVESSRVSAFDWQCQDSSGARVSDHQRFDTAFVACLNAPSGAYIQGGRYRITKGAAPEGTATLSWAPPTQNTDGSALTDLAGYRISYGTSPDALTQTVQVTGTTRHTIGNLSPGTYYFAVLAYTSDGRQSALSNVLAKTIL